MKKIKIIITILIIAILSISISIFFSKGENEYTDITSSNSNYDGWVEYNNPGVGIKFLYPQDWLVREEVTEYTNRVYIENQENKNYNITNTPEDFISMWIEYTTPSPTVTTYEKQIEFLDGLGVDKKILNNNSLEIHLYEFDYNPESERSGVGPHATAVWRDSQLIYTADTMDSYNKEKNEISVEFFKKILESIDRSDVN